MRYLLILFIPLVIGCQKTQYGDYYAPFTDFFSAPKKQMELVYPTVQKGRYVKESELTKEEFEKLQNYRCTEPQRHASHKPGLGYLHFSLNHVYTPDENGDFKFAGNYASVETQILHEGDNQSFKMTTSVSQSMPWGEISLENRTDRYELVHSTDPNLNPYYYESKELLVSNKKQSRTYPAYRPSPISAELLETTRSGAASEMYDRGYYELADGQKLQAIRTRQVLPQAPEVWLTYEAVYSDEVRNTKEALCRIGIVRQVELIAYKDDEEFKIWEEPSEYELLSIFHE